MDTTTYLGISMTHDGVEDEMKTSRIYNADERIETTKAHEFQ